MGGIKQTLGLKLGLQLFKGHMQISHPIRSQTGTIQLVGPIPGKDGNFAQCQHLHAVFRPKTEPHGAGLEHDAAQSAGGVLQGEIMVAGRVHLVIADLPPDAQAGQEPV